MPLAAPILQTELLKMFDSTRPDFVGWPATLADAATNWSNAVSTYYVQAVQPPLAAGVTAGAAAFIPVFVGAVQSNPTSGGPTAIDQGVQAFVVAASAVAAATIPGSIVVPPVGVPNLASQLWPPTVDATQPAATIATLIDAWSRTGSYTANPLAGAVVWS